ncbi:MAG: DUF721 domain-containing protein [Planctomycetaceae bacterium]|nr:DUF721 domain-containing protein [Planctomycetaceae bacterium]
MAKKRPTFPGTRKRALDKRALDVEDPEWRAWFLEVARRRAELEAAGKKFVVRTYEDDGDSKTVARRKADPIVLKKLVKEVAKDMRPRPADDLEAIRNTWASVAGPEIAGESAVYSFRGGILTVEVYSGILLQELRQFHATALVKDLRDVWPASVPLVQLKFRTGKQSPKP